MKMHLVPVMCALILTGITGCASHPIQPISFQTEANSAGGVKILSVRCRRDNNGLLVQGMVGRKVGYYGTRFRHLDLVVLAPDGKILAKHAVDFSRNPIPYSRFYAGRTSFSLRLASMPPQQSTIRVAVDCTELTACKLMNSSR